MKKLKLKLKENEVVHCATLKQAKKVLKIAHELGFKWKDEKSYNEIYNWFYEKENTVYYLNRGTWGNLRMIDERYIAITSKEFIKRHKNKNKYKVLEDKLNIIIQEKDKEIKAINDLFCNVLNRINVLEAIVNATNESVTIVKSDEANKNGWYKWKDTDYLMYHDFESNTKYGFNTIGEWVNKFKTIGSLASYTDKATHAEVEQRLIGEATKRGFKGDFELLNNTLYCNELVILFEGKWSEIQQPQIGDVVKAWDDDKSEFVYGVYNDIDKDSLYPYNIGLAWSKNIEKVTEISINDFRK